MFVLPRRLHYLLARNLLLGVTLYILLPTTSWTQLTILVRLLAIRPGPLLLLIHRVFPLSTTYRGRKRLDALIVYTGAFAPLSIAPLVLIQLLYAMTLVGLTLVLPTTLTPQQVIAVFKRKLILQQPFLPLLHTSTCDTIMLLPHGLIVLPTGSKQLLPKNVLQRLTLTLVTLGVFLLDRYVTSNPSRKDDDLFAAIAKPTGSLGPRPPYLLVTDA